jgi:hypothetical protein
MEKEEHYSERSLFLLPTSRPEPPDSAAAPVRRRPGVL